MERKKKKGMGAEDDVYKRSVSTGHQEGRIEMQEELMMMIWRAEKGND